jgi:hypothetical protein
MLAIEGRLDMPDTPGADGVEAARQNPLSQWPMADFHPRISGQILGAN